MADEKILSKISLNPKIMGGKPVIAGTRLTVQYILKLLADGVPQTDVIQEYEGLTLEDISACLLYASKIVDNITYLPSIE